MPQIGGPPQEIINRQLVSKCDILVGMFWTRLGTSTCAAESGTVEEISQFVAAGKPALLYFSSRRISPNKLDLKQQERLNAFREAMRPRAFTGNFSRPSELREVLLHHLLQQVRQIKSAALNLPSSERSAASPKWTNSANLFWLGDDLMWTMQISLRGMDPKGIFRGLNTSSHHLASLNLTDSSPGKHLAKLLHEVQSVEFQWTERQRVWFATEIDSICVEFGRLAAQNQPDFESGLSIKGAFDATN